MRRWETLRDADGKCSDKRCYFAFDGERARFPSTAIGTWLSECLAQLGAAPPAGEKWSGHSLRKCAASGAAACGVALHKICYVRVDGRLSPRQSLTTSIRPALIRPLAYASLVGSAEYLEWQFLALPPLPPPPISRFRYTVLIKQLRLAFILYNCSYNNNKFNLPLPLPCIFYRGLGAGKAVLILIKQL